MSIGKVHSWKKMLAQLLLLALPTAIFFFYLLWDLNRFYNILQNDWLKQGTYFTVGLTVAITFYAYRFRFITTAAVVFSVCYLIYKSLGNATFGEFDAFYFSIQFLIFTILFSVGWLSGFGFSRSKYFTIAWSVLLLVLQIVVVSKTTDIKVNVLINAFAPVLAYSFYIIYTAELIRNMNEDEPHFAWFIIKRMFGFGLVVLVLFLAIFSLFMNDFKAIEKEWGGAQGNYDKGKGNSESMNQTDKNGFVRNKDQTKLSGSLSKDKPLVFVAKLDNYFADERTPNPLYFTSCYYTKFDTLTQTFEIDSLMPYNDLYNPDPSKIPLYFVKTDSTVIKNTFATKNRKVVSADIYKVILSPNAYLAPSTAFSCQPMSIPKEYKEQFKSMYRAKMWVSDLNSAYFIYNPAGNMQLKMFQEQRFNVLRKVTKISGPDAKFMKYYTFMPRNEDYKKITELAKQITTNAPTPIDKMIAIRDYYLSKDEFGQPLFKYSDNPGIPGMPSASKLNYFLFDNKKGYCAYYAGATLFMLRSLGIPSRVAAGYLTVDRSSKNPGWYWFYADQAHAWVQVYFQNYGWIDFDTTVPDVNTHQSPQPDGTPPMNMPQTYMVADGEVKSVDVSKKQIEMSVKKLLYHDKDYETTSAKDITMDVSLATFVSDTGAVQIGVVKKGMHITAVSYAEVLKNILAGKNDSLAAVLKKLPTPVPVDEIKIFVKEELQKLKKKEKEIIKEPTDWLKVGWNVLLLIATLIILLFLLPWMIWQFFNTRAKKQNAEKAYNAYRAALYYLNQLGYKRDNYGPHEYALMIDQKFETTFTKFSNVYQKVKYSSIALSEGEQKIVNEFYNSFIKQVKTKTPFKTRVNKFLNIYNTIHYFTQPK
jgi:hypothetical protein